MKTFVVVYGDGSQETVDSEYFVVTEEGVGFGGDENLLRAHIFDAFVGHRKDSSILKVVSSDQDESNFETQIAEGFDAFVAGYTVAKAEQEQEIINESKKATITTTKKKNTSKTKNAVTKKSTSKSK